MAAARAADPDVLWEGNVDPRPQRPGRSARLATAVAVSLRGDCAALAGRRACYLTGTPIRDFARRRPRTPPATRFGARPGDRMLLVFGGSQAVRRFNAAVAAALPRLVERVHVVHVTGDAGYADALAGRERLPVGCASATGRAVPARRDGRGARRRRTCSSGARAARRWPRRPRSACRSSWCRTPTPPATNGPTPAARRLRCRAARSRTRHSTPPRCSRPARSSTIPRVMPRMAAAARELGRPGAAAAVAELVLAAAERRPLPEPADIDRRSQGVAA